MTHERIFKLNDGNCAPGIKREERAPTDPRRGWTFLTSHATVLLHIAVHPDDTMHSVAQALALTERTTAAVIAALRKAGYVEVERRGRHNHYTVNRDLPLRRLAHAQLSVHDLLDALTVLMGSEEKGVEPRRRSSTTE